MAEPVSSSSVSSSLAELSIQEFLTALAARTPAPGGGSMTALTAALAAAQLQMVIAYTRGKPRFAEFENVLADYDARLSRAGAVLRELMDEDKSAYEALNPFMKLPAAVRHAAATYPAIVAAAVQIPQAVAAAAAGIVEAAEHLQNKVSRMLLSDLGVAAATAMGAVESAEFNVLVNLPLLENPAQASSTAKAMSELKLQTRRRYQRISEKLLEELAATSLTSA
jgi:formiminotetrahydrofolate cyclodeaminase